MNLLTGLGVWVLSIISLGFYFLFHIIVIYFFNCLNKVTLGYLIVTRKYTDFVSKIIKMIVLILYLSHFTLALSCVANILLVK